MITQECEKIKTIFPKEIFHHLVSINLKWFIKIDILCFSSVTLEKYISKFLVKHVIILS